MSELMLTKVDPLWAMECQGIQLQAVPDEAGVKALQDLQHEIFRATDLNLRLIPGESLHCTVLTVLHPGKHLGRENFEIWSERGDEWNCLLALHLLTLKPLVLRFDSLLFSDMAIVALAPEPEALREVRAKMSRAIDYRGHHPRPPDIAHITLARYGSACAVPDVKIEFEPIHMRVEQCRLIKETVSPALKYEEISWLNLDVKN